MNCKLLVDICIFITIIVYGNDRGAEDIIRPYTRAAGTAGRKGSFAEVPA